MTAPQLLLGSTLFFLASVMVSVALIRIAEVFYEKPEYAPGWIAIPGIVSFFITGASAVGMVVALMWWALVILGVLS